MGLFDCGPSSAEKRLAAKQESLSDTYSAAFSKYFGAQSQVLQNLNNIFTPIAQAGPDQQGFGSNTLAALHTQATQGVGVNYAKATRALQTGLAARGGGNEFLPSGAEGSLKGELAASAANQQSNEDLAITNANYATGRENYNRATAGLQALGQQYNPSSFGSLANQGTEAAFKDQSQITQEQQAASADIMGAVTGVAKGALAFGTGGMSAMLDSPAGASQPGSFFSGGLKALGFGG